MSLAAALTRMPRAHEPDRGREARALVPALDGDLGALVEGAAGCCPYLATLVAKEADWLPQALDNADAGAAAVLDAARGAGADGSVKDDLRQAKRRLALLTALADLGGAWPLEKVTGLLTDLADAACEAALRDAIAIQIRRGKLPGMTEDDVPVAGGMCVLAMGKMGARELNYSSDIDLICLFDETRFDPGDYHEARAAFVRATRAMSATLSDLTAQGYVFRTDLRLRPDPAVTPVCMAMEAAERYYESVGRTWERAAYIKARPCAGDAAAGERFLEAIRPFVWRRHLDFAAIQDAHDMRLAIREHKGLHGPITLPGHDMKLGRGGIREIEFFTQTRQIIAGGRDPDLRRRGTLAALAVLAEKGWVEQAASDTLADHYVAHRTVEHRLQMIQDAQTHSLPGLEEGFARLAHLMDRDEDALRTDLRRRLEEVHELTEGFFAPSKPAPVPHATEVHDFDADIMARWPSYPALRGTRSRTIFERLKPDLLMRLSESAKPDEALVAFDGFLKGLPAGVQLFSLLDVNPQLRDLLIDIIAVSPDLAAYLSHNPVVFDAVIGGDFFSDWPSAQALADGLAAALEPEPDYETRLDRMRRWRREWHFRVGVHLLRGLIDPRTAALQYSDIARAILGVLWPEVQRQFAERHGQAPGRGAVVLGMGSLGEGRLGPRSDLDLIVVYDPAEQDMSEGRKPLPTRQYYARLTQALITALTAPMSQGRLYEADMRLRPSGNQGPVATSWSAFRNYQRDEAWVWEHLALTRASAVAGPEALCAEVEAFRAEVLSAPRDLAEICREVATMRARISAAKGAGTLWDTKVGPGRTQEIELIAQAGNLVAGKAERALRTGLSNAEAAGILGPGEADALSEAHATLFDFNMAARLLTADTPDPGQMGQGGRAFLQRVTGAPSMDAAAERLSELYATADTIITRALAPYEGEDRGA
ncbi:glutamine-synthetase adenylyltransferase [Sulfitobacter sp. D35]|uniref:[protein-PII] uridylyltransferase family protein n=1 Tax=Sulfitobacter sp. D35 TaxID=3083252 RepID=UPI00296E3CE3|nr:glutamine-synthetase adenylyltransferase [Sulfitobacter sp. D35]MDW4497687.1 glutamine-synthetase adenylyltransferase [Sulfitobacter sp. D35]